MAPLAGVARENPEVLSFDVTNERSKKAAVCGAALETFYLDSSVMLFRFRFLWTAP